MKIFFIPTTLLVIILAPLQGKDNPRPPEKIWNLFCTACHGKEGKAATPMGKALNIPDLTDKKYADTRSRELIKQRITEGMKNEDGVIRMAPYNALLSETEIESMVTYVWNLSDTDISQ